MYAKLFASIYQGTLRGDTHGLVVFTNMLAHADAAGWVDIHPKAIAEEVGLPVEAVNTAIQRLELPDPESRSPEEDGRRIVRLDAHRAWGWRIVNHAKYRAIRSEEDRREQNRLAQERFRNKNKADSKQSKPRKPKSAQAEAEAEAEAEETKTATLKRAAPPDGVADVVWKDFMAIRRAKRAPMTATALDGLRREAEKAGIGLEQALRMCCERGWQGFKADWLTGKAVIGITVPGPSGPDPELERLKAHKGAAPSLETLAKLAELRRKAA